MPKKATANLSVVDLEKMLKDAKAEVERLQQERVKLQTRMEKVDGRLAQLVGATKPGPKPKLAVSRPAKGPAKPKGKKPGRKKMTLAQHTEPILKSAGKPMAMKDIVAELRKKGVSDSANLDQQVYQVIKGGKVNARNVSRGVYEWVGDGGEAKAAPAKKKAGKKAAKASKK
jgi:hypothetical protein